MTTRTIRTIYIACDDEEFMTMEDCLNHEYRISHLPRSIRWYGINGEQLQPQTTRELNNIHQKYDTRND